jgi:hypothetical protein
MMERDIKQKLYAYVDESGQDTEGKIFIVSVVIMKSKRDIARKQLSEIERTSRKLDKKWTKSRPQQRLSYIQQVIELQEMMSVYYSFYQNTRAYVDLTVLTTAKALGAFTQLPYRATIMIDGLKKSEQNYFSSGLRKLRISVNKVRGINDQVDEFIRLADAIAGFIRDGFDGNQEMQELFRQATQKSFIKEV